MLNHRLLQLHLVLFGLPKRGLWEGPGREEGRAGLESGFGFEALGLGAESKQGLRLRFRLQLIL